VKLLITTFEKRQERRKRKLGTDKRKLGKESHDFFFSTRCSEGFHKKEVVGGK
jgi:hypothetical protein